MTCGLGRAICGLALLVAAQLGCATVPACPAKGGPPWRELTSDHFVLRTDLQEDAALLALRHLEDARAAMLALVWPRAPELRGRIDAYALASTAEVQAFLGLHFVGVHLRVPPFPPTLLVAGLGRENQQHANHEIAHALSLQLLPVQPVWFAEGLAEYLSTIRRSDDDSQAVAGDAEAGDYRFVQHFGVSPLSTLLGPLPADDFEQQRFYATSWLLVHYLFNVRPDALERFQRRLGQLEPGKDAFRAEFPELAAGQLESVLKEYAASGRYAMSMRPLPSWNGRHQERPLTDAEVHASRALLGLLGAPMSGRGDSALEAARADLAEALQAPRPPVEALVLAFYQPRLKPSLSKPELARLAVQTHPEQWMSWLLATELTAPGSADRQQALARAMTADPDATEISFVEALELARVNRWAETLELTNEILPAGAMNHDVWLLHLQALDRTGHCQEAKLWGAALEGYLDGDAARKVAGVRAKLTCGQSAAPAPAASQAAGAHAGERAQADASRAGPAVRQP